MTDDVQPVPAGDTGPPRAEDAHDGLSPRQLLAIERIVKERVEQDHQFVSSVIGTSAKIAGVALFAALSFFTFLGYQTFGEIKKQITTIINDKVDEQLKEGSPSVQVLQAKLQVLHVLSLIAFHRQTGRYSTSTSEEDQDEQIGLSVADALTLLETLREEGGDEGTASGALEVLSDNPEVLPKLERTLIAMASNPPAESVVALRTDIRARVIDLLALTSEKRTFRELRAFMGDESHTPEVRAAVIRFAEKIEEPVDKATLEKALASDDAYLRAAALRLLAVTYPDSKPLEARLKQLEDPRKREDHLIEIVELGDAMGAASRNSKLDEGLRKISGQRNLDLLQFLMSCQRCRFRVTHRSGEAKLLFTSGSPFSPEIRIELEGDDLLESLPSLLAKKVSSLDEFTRIVRIVTSSLPSSTPVQITAQLPAGSNLLKGQHPLFANAAPDEIRIRVVRRLTTRSPIPQPQLVAEWTDSVGPHTEAFDAFSNPVNVEFAVAVDAS